MLVLLSIVIQSSVRGDRKHLIPVFSSLFLNRTYIGSRIIINNCRTTSSIHDEFSKQKRNYQQLKAKFKFECLRIRIQKLWLRIKSVCDSYFHFPERESQINHMSNDTNHLNLYATENCTQFPTNEENIRKYHSAKNIQFNLSISIPNQHSAGQFIIIIWLQCHGFLVIYFYIHLLHSVHLTYFCFCALDFSTFRLLFDWLSWVNVYPVASNMLFISFVVFFCLLFFFIHIKSKIDWIVALRANTTYETNNKTWT